MGALQIALEKLKDYEVVYNYDGNNKMPSGFVPISVADRIMQELELDIEREVINNVLNEL